MFLSVTYAIKVGRAYEVLVDMPLSSFLDLVANLGYEGVEPNIADPNRFDVKSFSKALEERGLKTSAISTGLAYTTYGYSLTSKSKEYRSKAIEFMVKYCEIAYELGCNTVVIGLIRGRGGENEDRDLLEGSVKEILDRTEHLRTTLVLEPLNRYETRIINSVDEAAQFVERISKEYRGRVAILFDTFHACLEHRDPYAAYLRIKDMVKHIHIADSNRKPPGEGMIDWIKMIAIVKACGYSGFLSLECLPSPTYVDSIRKTSEMLLPILRVFT